MRLPDDGVGERLEAGDAAFCHVALLYDHRPRRPSRDHISREVRATYALAEITQLYAALLHCVVAASDLMVTDTASKGGHAPILFTMSDTGFGEHPFPDVG